MNITDEQLYDLMALLDMGISYTSRLRKVIGNWHELRDEAREKVLRSTYAHMESVQQILSHIRLESLENIK